MFKDILAALILLVLFAVFAAIAAFLLYGVAVSFN